jgi:hypothetical protein
MSEEYTTLYLLLNIPKHEGNLFHQNLYFGGGGGFAMITTAPITTKNTTRLILFLPF